MKSDEFKLSDDTKFKELEVMDFPDKSILDEFKWEDEAPVFHQEAYWHSDLFVHDGKSFVTVLLLVGDSKNVILKNTFEVI